MNKKIVKLASVACVLFALIAPVSASVTPAVDDKKISPRLRLVTQPIEKSAEAHEVYFLQLLELALQKTEATDGPFSIEPYKENFTNRRSLTELAREDSVIDIMWAMSDKKREAELLPIKISILRGVNSYRVFLIRKEDQELFHHIHSLQDLRRLTAGLVTSWPDTKVMQANGLPVITAAQYELLFTMLAGKRFDYFPRGLHEIWNELQAHPDRQFAVEDSIMLHYPAPVYFFVNKKNTALAQRIEKGLRIAMDDGSFNQLFFSIPGFKRGYDEMHNSSRVLFELTNDNSTED